MRIIPRGKMRKFYLRLGVAGGVIAGFLGLASKVGATTTYNYIDVNATSVASVVAYIGNLFSDVSLFIWLAIGLPLGFYVIVKTIGLVRGRAK